MSDIIPFRFTVTTDTHGHVYDSGDGVDVYQYFQDACDEINSVFGSAGDFMISTGDVSDTLRSTSPEKARETIDERFGSDFRWISAVGNHDIAATDGLGIEWLRGEWGGSNPSSSTREAIQDFAYAGPSGCSTTQYYYFHKGVMFIVMNWFWDGTTSATADEDGYHDDTDAQGGKIIDSQIDWLRDLFDYYPGYRKIVCGHGNAFAFAERHDDYSGLGGATKENRDVFWKLLEDNKVIAYLHGHTHERRIDYVDNSYWSGGSVEDSWSYGKSNVAHICAGQIKNKWPSSDSLSPVSYPTFMNVDVTETSVKFDIYEATSVDGHTASGWQIILTETVSLVDSSNNGGVWYYKQDKFGSDWFNKVSNKKGWSVDFNLRVSDVQNSQLLVDEGNKGKGAGVYVNDGRRQEIINFLDQEIVFSKSNDSVLYNTTTENDYRLIGKEDNLKLFARPSGDSRYSEIANVNFSTSATPNGNALNPSVFEDTSGDLHASWWDDGDGHGSIFYSKFSGGGWSDPEEIVSLDNGVQFPDIIVDSSGTIYVVFESKQTEGSVVGMVYRNTIGWSEPYYIGRNIGYCRYPKLTFDSQSNVCVVWEDSRHEFPEVYTSIFSRDYLTWGVEYRLSTNSFGSYRPSITSYMDSLYIAWTKMDENDTSSIEIIKYNSINSSRSSVETVSGTVGKADHSSVLVNVAGKIFVTWHDDVSGSYKIYAAVLTPTFEFLTSSTAIVDGNGGAKYPTLSEQLVTGNIYVIWQDFKDSIHEGSSINDIRPSNSAIFSAYYDGEFFISSGNGDSDIMMSFSDDRNTYSPDVPPFFSAGIPIVYESYFSEEDEYTLIASQKILLNVKSLTYDLSRDGDTFIVTCCDDEYNSNNDWNLNNNASSKEIRFGDFSDVMNAHYIFKDFKYYIDDAVDAFGTTIIDPNTVDVESLSAHDVKVNNYGDTWIVGMCGVYYFVNNYNSLVKVGPGSEVHGLDGVDLEDSEAVEAEYETLKKFRTIAFDNYNNIYLGGESGIFRYSTSHVDGFKELILTSVSGTINNIVFDKDNIMYVGTSDGLYSYNIDIENDPAISLLGTITATSIESDVLTSEFVGKNITALDIDVNNCLWIGTSDSGVYRFYKGHLLHFTTSHGLPSNIVNDIAVRNTAVRYVATSSGIAKMVGFNFEHILSSKDDIIWSNNVKSIEWKNPNVLLAGTMSRINQVIINDDDNTYSTVFFDPASSFNKYPDDFNVYYLVGDYSVGDNDVVEVYVNGNLVHFGYDISSDKSSIRFRTPLSSFDVVEVILRKDLNEIYSFDRTQDEINGVGDSVVRVKELSDFESDLYSVTEGDENEVKIKDSDSILPYDRIHLDTHAPNFEDGAVGIDIGQQVDGSIVKMNISGATDAVDGFAGSGIEGMIISNYDNFTTDGTIPQEYVPFSTSVNHDLGASLENIVTDLIFSSGSGSVISYVVGNNLYAATSMPAVVYKYNWVSESWDVLYTYDSDQHVDFITRYNDKLVISVGNDTDVAKIYIYDYESDGKTTNLSGILPAIESRAYCSYDLEGKLYIGTGVGQGDEYRAGAGNGGSIYVFDDEGTNQTLTPIADSMDDNIYSITSVDGSNNLIAASGPDGYIFELDVETGAAPIIYSGSEALISISFLDVGGQLMVFVGGESDGVIRKTLSGSNTYDVTFRTIPSKISVLKVLEVVDPSDDTKNYLTVYAAVGDVVYYLSDGGTWTWKYTHNEIVNDITLDDGNDALYVVSDSGITRIKPIIDSKVVYLKLIDRAGNESILEAIPTTPEEIDDTPWVDYVNITTLKDFIKENKIFMLDELGNETTVMTDINKFYSGETIEEERGEYLSEIFDGSNDLVKWETISWETTILHNTNVKMYVRVGKSANDILIEDWIGPFDSSELANVPLGDVGCTSSTDLDYLSCQFIQFKVVLTSRTKNISPSFHRASIRAVTSESVHFFTTNFTMPTKINKGILTSQKVVPVSADIVFGINTTNSIDWTEYQPVDENRIFNVNQTGHNLRVGIKFISPNRSLVEPVAYDEYGPYNSNLYVNTIDFDFTNGSGATRDYHFRVTLYSDAGLNNEVFSAYSAESADGFSADGSAISEDGVSLAHGSTSNILFSVPGSANITCNTYYFVKIEYIYGTSFETFSQDDSFIASCTSSFIDNIDFDFTNEGSSSNYYHFIIKFYRDLERTIEHLTVISANDRSGWFVDDVQIPEAGALVTPGSSVNVVYRPTPSDFSTGDIYYLTIEAHDGTDPVLASNSYTFQVRDVQSTEYCGGYMDVPIVKNFGLMFELDNNEFITLNI